MDPETLESSEAAEAEEAGEAEQGAEEPKPDIFVHSNPTYQKMLKKYGGLKLANFPRRLFECDFEELMANEERLTSEFGFTREELNHIVKRKPLILLSQEEHERR
mmetsp:Transcript_17588/g.29694  ORF Transcript_17588/g.29694 Transcript_17588/m.29694 type:complete len:105 (+) Transcript_17588:240-554(+)